MQLYYDISMYLFFFNEHLITFTEINTYVKFIFMFPDKINPEKLSD
jgi:hypothetical protein